MLAGLLLWLVLRAAPEGQWDDWEGPAWRRSGRPSLAPRPKLGSVTDPKPFSRDTSPEVHRMIIDRYRAMTAKEKLHLVDALTRDCEALALAGIRMRHPSAGEAELRLRLGGLRMGRDLVRAATGWDPGEGRP